jgi:hypothetical protein
VATAQSMVQSDGNSFTAQLAFDTLAITNNSSGKPRWMKTLKIDVRKSPVHEHVPPKQMDGVQLLITKDFSSEQLLLDAILHALHSQPDLPVMLAARGDTPINRTTRVVAKLQDIAAENELPHLELFPCTLPMMDTVAQKVVPFVGFLLRQSAPASA